MHARLDELLSLRDGEPVDARVKTHLQHCTECQDWLATSVTLRHRLRALPAAPEPPPGAWARIEQRVAASRPCGGRRMPLASLAAAVSMAALGLFAVLRLSEGPSPAPGARTMPAPTVTTDPVAQLRARSQALETVLAALPARPAVRRAAMSVPIDTLEAQVQWLDHELSTADALAAPGDAERLWRGRVEVMNSLLQLRYVEAQRAL